MIKTLVFHIGDPKNGSSSIQGALLDQTCQCDTVRIARPRELNASGLANSLLDQDKPRRRKRLWRQKRAWALEEAADIGVISAEFFARVRPALLHRVLHEHLPEHAAEARVLAYVRPHAAWIASAYGTRVKTGGTLDTLSEFAARTSQGVFMNYHARFARWREVFGDRFTLRPFSAAQLHGGDVVTDFFHQILDGASFSFTASAAVNKSLSVEEIAAMRVIQEALMRLEVPKPLRLALGGALGRELEGRARLSGNNRLRLDRASAEGIRSKCIEDAYALDRGFFRQPLMVAALDRAVEEALPQEQSVEARDYFSNARVTEMQEIVAALVPPLMANPGAWRKDYRFRKAPRSVHGKAAAGAEQQADIEHVWAQITQLVLIMGESGAGERV
jgi:hypothetical protein